MAMTGWINWMALLWAATYLPSMMTIQVQAQLRCGDEAAGGLAGGVEPVG
jgi:hypothetical protein